MGNISVIFSAIYQRLCYNDVFNFRKDDSFLNYIDRGKYYKTVTTPVKLLHGDTEDYGYFCDFEEVCIKPD